MRSASIRLESLTVDVLHKVVELYDSVVGGHGLRYFNSGTLQYAKELLENRSAVEWRFGSRLSGHSKLWIQRDWMHPSGEFIYFSFGANVDIKSVKTRKEVETLEANFSHAVSGFLKEKGLAVSD